MLIGQAIGGELPMSINNNIVQEKNEWKSWDNV
jgi:hypothetical protein